MLSIKPIKAFSDNYIWLLSTNEGSIVVDPGEADEIIELSKSKEIDLKGILVTHHHYDHTNGIKNILKSCDVKIYGPDNNIGEITNIVKEGDNVNIIGLNFNVIEIPGHTLDHIAFICNKDGDSIIFCGDTLFSGGCGRVFEGTFKQMFESINKIAKLPLNTRIFCGHEYTASNLEFAKEVEPNNILIKEKLDQVKKNVSKGIPSLPSDLNTELKINPFLRCDNKDVKEKIANKFGYTESKIDIFKALRKWKDNF